MKRFLLSACDNYPENFQQKSSRSLTPAFAQLKKKKFPSLQEDNFFSRLNTQTEKKYSILNVPKIQAKNLLVLREVNTETIKKQENPVIVLPEEFNEFNKKKLEKNSCAKLLKIRRTYRSCRNPNVDSLKTELLKLETQAKDRRASDVRSEENKENKCARKSDIESILESQEMIRKYRSGIRKKEITIDLRVNTEVARDEDENNENGTESNDSSLSLSRDNDFDNILRKSQTPTMINKEIKNSINSFGLMTSLKKKKMCFDRFNTLNRNNHRILNENTDKVLRYQKDQFGIIKNTNIFAEKIMRSIKSGQKMMNHN